MLVMREWDLPPLDAYYSLKSSGAYLLFVQSHCRTHKFVIKARPDRWQTDVFWPGVANMLAGKDGWGLALIASRSGALWVVSTGHVVTITPHIHIFTSKKSLVRLPGSINRLAGMLAGTHQCLQQLAANVRYGVLKAPPANCDAVTRNKVEALCQWLGPNARSAFENGRLIHQYAQPATHWVHGDIRPHNIGLSVEGRAYLLIDFDNVSQFSREYEVVRAYLCCMPLRNVHGARRDFEAFLKAYHGLYPLGLEADQLLCHYLYVALHDVSRHLPASGVFSGYPKIVYHRCAHLLKLITR